MEHCLNWYLKTQRLDRCGLFCWFHLCYVCASSPTVRAEKLETTTHTCSWCSKSSMLQSEHVQILCFRSSDKAWVWNMNWTANLTRKMSTAKSTIEKYHMCLAVNCGLWEWPDCREFLAWLLLQARHNLEIAANRSDFADCYSNRPSAKQSTWLLKLKNKSLPAPYSCLAVLQLKSLKWLLILLSCWP